MIHRITLENWRAHRKSVFEFEPGTNVLVGVMGSGKTSVMDSICFALFGTFPSLNARKVSMEETIMSKPNPAERALVQLEFKYGDIPYKVERTIHRKGINTAKLYEEGRMIAGPKPTEVTRRIEDLIEVNYELFSRAVYAEQNQLDYFLRISPSQRKEKFDELLEINKYETVRANAVTLRTRIKRAAEERKKWLAQQESVEIGKEKEVLEKKIREREAEIRKLETEIERMGKILKSAQEGLDKMERKGKEYRALEERRMQVQAMQKAISAEIKEIEEVLEKKKGVSIAQEKARLEQQGKECRESKQKAVEEMEQNTEQYNVVIREIGINEQKMKQLQEVIPHLEGEHSHCPVCKKELGATDRERISVENKKELEKLFAENKERGVRQKALIQSSSRLKDRVRSLDREMEALGNAGNQLALLGQRTERKAHLESQLPLLDKERDQVTKQMEQTGFNEEKMQKERQHWMRMEGNLATFRSRKKDGEEMMQGMRTSMHKMAEMEQQLEKARENIRKLEKRSAQLDLFTNALMATQSQMRSTLIDTVNQAMEDIWPRVYPYGDLTSAKIEVSEGSYEVLVRETNGKWVRAEGILSGGERSAVALTLRVAISLVLTQNLSYLILDEPTHNLDQRAIRELSSLTREHLPELVNQVFIITHDKQMEQAASGALYILSRKKENDSPTELTKGEVVGVIE